MELTARVLKLHSHFMCQETEAQRSSRKRPLETPCAWGSAPGPGALPALSLSGLQLAQETGIAPQATDKKTEAQSRERTCLRSPAC